MAIHYQLAIVSKYNPKLHGHHGYTNFPLNEHNIYFCHYYYKPNENIDSPDYQTYDEFIKTYKFLKSQSKDEQILLRQCLIIKYNDHIFAIPKDKSHKHKNSK